MNLTKAPKGLEGVIVAETRISKVDGERGQLTYRGYDATELASKLSFEQVVLLLWFGKIPESNELVDFKLRLDSRRKLPNWLTEFLPSVPTLATPLTVLRTAVSALGMFAREDESTTETGTSLIARFPSILARRYRLVKGLHQIESDSKLSHASNYLYILSGKIPSDQNTSALNSYLILLSDHGMNASTFAARVAISTLTDAYSAVCAAVGTLKGPLHGGAPSQVFEMLSEIGSKDRVKEWLKTRIEKKQRIMGFGHRVYRTQDPRSRALKEIARRIAEPEIFDLAATIEEEARELLQKEHPERVLDTNVEFYSALVLNAVGIPSDMFTATFACARIAGWTAHIIEQLSDNRIFRPESEYIGPEGLRLG